MPRRQACPLPRWATESRDKREDAMAGRVAGKKVFVTGAAQGLGAAIARGCAAEGAKVALADINASGVETLARELNSGYGADTAFAYALDVTNEQQWVAALEAANG